MFDAAVARDLDAVYRTPDVVTQRREVLRALRLVSGERVLDVGSGPGLLAVEAAERVGQRGHVTGVDPSGDMLELARRRAAPLGGRVTFLEGEATRLPFPDGSFDAAVSTQVYEYVPDIAAALSELRRVLRPGERAVILDTDWDSMVWNAGDAQLMRRVLDAWRSRFADPYLPRTLTRRLHDAGFTVIGRAVLTLFNPDYDPDTYSAAHAKIMADFVAGRCGLTSEDTRRWLEDLDRLGRAGHYFFSLNRYLFTAVKPGPRAGRDG